MRGWRHGLLLSSLWIGQAMLLLAAPADKDAEIQDAIEQWMERQTATDDNLAEEEWIDCLNELGTRPLNLNTATREMLEAYPFLTAGQVENLLEYRYDYGELKSLQELGGIAGWKTEDRDLYQAFFYVAPAEVKTKRSVKQVFQDGKQSVMLRADYGLQTRAGYLNGKYLGDPWGGMLKYRFNDCNLSFGFSAEQDAGEPFDWQYNRGFDFYSAHWMLKDIGRCKALALGDFKLNFGQGLLLQSSAFFGSGSHLEDLVLRNDGILPYTSTAETGYFRGIATSWEGKGWMGTAFASHTWYNPNEGYHRTESEIARRYNHPCLVTGGNLQYRGRFFKVGATALYDFVQQQGGVSVDFRALAGRMQLAGELAVDFQGHCAFIAQIQARALSALGIACLLRYYDRQFQAEFGNAYSVSRHPAGESGVYIGLNLNLSAWTISSYADVFALTGSTLPTRGIKAYLLAVYSPAPEHRGQLNYQVQARGIWQQPPTSQAAAAGKYQKHCWKFQHQSTFHDRLSVGGGATATFYQDDAGSFGFLLYGQTGYRFARPDMGLYGRVGFFDVPDYNCRIYATEKDVLQAYCSPLYYGQGCRLSLQWEYRIKKVWTIQLKIAHTFYTDERTHISSGNEQIEGCRKTDLRLLLQWKW